MKNRKSRIVAIFLMLTLLSGVLSSVIKANSILQKNEQNELLIIEKLEKIMQGDTGEILYREESPFEEDGIHTVTEDIFTEDYRILITKTDQGASAFVEVFATGMGYEIVDGQIIETYDLNEIRNTMIIWEMPEEDEKRF